MHYIHSTTTRTQGWQADCWNWARESKPFELHGVESQHLPFCREVSKTCNCKYHSHTVRDEAVAVFEPAANLEN